LYCEMVERLGKGKKKKGSNLRRRGNVHNLDDEERFLGPSRKDNGSEKTVRGKCNPSKK